MRFAIVGAGFSGAVLAHELAKHGFELDVFESRNHIGGNCYTERDKETNVMVHVYGPHIFHTNNQFIWDYVNKFTTFIPYVNRVKAISGGRVFSLPINLLTINQFFNKTFNPEEAKAFINTLSIYKEKEPENFEEQGLRFLGKELYESFFSGYTWKQWGRPPTNLPSSILKRLPVRFNYDDNYFNHRLQGIPELGYTVIFEKMLEHPNIHLFLNTSFESTQLNSYDHIFYTGPIDAWFNYRFGNLAYRTLDFVREVYHGDFQGCAVINYNDLTIPFTRITEHKHFAPWELHDQTVIYKEFSREYMVGDIPYYPIRLVDDRRILNLYLAEGKKQSKVSFLGRLATYRYLDMDVTIEEAINASKVSIAAVRNNMNIPAFFVDPI